MVTTKIIHALFSMAMSMMNNSEESVSVQEAFRQNSVARELNSIMTLSDRGDMEAALEMIEDYFCEPDPPRGSEQLDALDTEFQEMELTEPNPVKGTGA